MHTAIGRQGAAWQRLFAGAADGHFNRFAARRLRRALAVGAALLATAAVMAAEPSPQMPQRFPVDALTIRLVRTAGSASFIPLKIELKGHAGGMLSQGDGRWPFAYPDQALVGLLDALYAAGFFEMSSSLGSRTAAQLGPDGSVSLIGWAASSSGGNSVCVDVAAFEKCVRYGAQAPVELLRLVQAVYDKARRLTGKP